MVIFINKATLWSDLIRGELLSQSRKEGKERKGSTETRSVDEEVLDKEIWRGEPTFGGK